VRGANVATTVRSAEPFRAVIYLRVSSQGQVKTDYDPEGNSIPSQRVACTQRAKELGAVIVDEYVEPGKSAKELDKRDEFQKMRRRITTKKDVDYVIVYAFNRAFRNAADRAIVSREFRKEGARIIATNLVLDDTPESEMIEGIMSYVDEYRIKSDGKDIAYKMGQKVKRGGTIAIAKIGYLNVREKPEGREIRTIAVDKKRAPYIKQIFELYATGRYTYGDIREILTERGLRTRPTKKYPAGTPISIHSIGNILTDRYYCGYVTYQDTEYQGRHPAIITEELYNRVQRVLAANIYSGTRRRVHHHHLKGCLWCHRCKRRLIVAKGNGNGGTYFYYLCTGRQTQQCDQPYIPIHGPNGVEHAISNHYNTVNLGDALHTKARTELDTALHAELASTDNLRAELAKRLQSLDRQENAYLELVGDPEWPQPKLTAKMRNIRQQRQGIQAQLADLDTNLDAGKEIFILGLNLLRQPRALYDQGTDEIKKLLTTVIFSKIYLDAHPDGTISITSHELAEPFNTITAATHDRYDHTQIIIPLSNTQTDNTTPRLAHWQPQPLTTNWGDTLAESITPARTPNDLPNHALNVRGSSKYRLVDLTCQHKNQTLLVEGPEITIRPVGTRRVTGGPRGTPLRSSLG